MWMLRSDETTQIQTSSLDPMFLEVTTVALRPQSTSTRKHKNRQNQQIKKTSSIWQLMESVEETLQIQKTTAEVFPEAWLQLLYSTLHKVCVCNGCNWEDKAELTSEYLVSIFLVSYIIPKWSLRLQNTNSLTTKVLQTPSEALWRIWISSSTETLHCASLISVMLIHPQISVLGESFTCLVLSFLDD